MTMCTPWGQSQNETIILTNGIVRVSTAGHGGVRVYARLNRKIPLFLRKAARLGESGWYEEDIEWCIPAVVFEDHWRDWANGTNWTTGDFQMESAHKTFRDAYPDGYERYTGAKLLPGQSWKRDERLFIDANRDSHICEAAWGDWHPQVPEGMVAVYGVRPSDGDRMHFLVPREDYAPERLPRIGSYRRFLITPGSGYREIGRFDG